MNVVQSNRSCEAAALVRKHGAYVWRTLLLFGVRAADVDDVTQEVLITTFSRQHTRKKDGPMRPWIRGICVRKAMSHRRRAHVRREVFSACLPEATTACLPDQVVEASRQLRQLHLALDSLGEAARMVFVLYEIEGLTMREVADTLQCPLQTAYSRHRAAKVHVVAMMRRAAMVGRPANSLKRVGGMP